MSEQKRAAVFTDDQVESLNAYQDARVFHPFTCCGLPMRATTDGFTCSDCLRVQDWAHGFMADWSWKRADTQARIRRAIPAQEAPDGK